MEKTICLNCKKKVDYNEREIKEKVIIKGEEVEYNKKIAICKDCGKEVWVEEFDDLNAIEAIEQYCRNHDLITIAEIKHIMERYSIGKKTLAKLLGWGEVTIIRFLAGQIPSKEYSDKLKSLEDPIEFFSLLEKNKDFIAIGSYARIVEKFNLLVSNSTVMYKCYNDYSVEIPYRNVSVTSNGGAVCRKQLYA